MKSERYTAAVLKLIPLAQGDTGGSRVAAQILLSAYNGEEFQLNIVDLTNLDRKHYIAALSVIRGRVELGIEPHTVLERGDKIFQELWLKWERYNVANRGIPDSYSCYGTGKIYTDPEDANYELKPCPRCGGKGFTNE